TMYPLSLGFRYSSAASHEANDFELVAILDRDIAKGRARNNFEIALHRNTYGIKPKLADQFGDADALVHPAMLAVDADLDCVINRHERGADRNVRACAQS